MLLRYLKKIFYNSVAELRNIIKLTDEELRESEEYEDFESFLSTIEEKYGFRLSNCQWMTTEELNICRYENGREVEDYA